MKQVYRFLFVGGVISTSILFSSVAYAAGPSVSVSVIKDVTPPSYPTYVVAKGIKSSQILVTWSPSTDNVSLAGYVIFRDYQFYTSVRGTSFLDTNLKPNKEHSYAIAAFDEVGNLSFVSAPKSATSLK